MQVAMMVELAMVLAAFGLGANMLWQARRNRQRWIDAMGLRLNGAALRDLLAGFLIAASAMLGIFCTELRMNAIAAGAASGAALPELAQTALIKFAFTVKEELVMRCLLLAGLLLVLRGRQALAIGVSAVAFGLIHLSNPGATLLSVIGNSLGGVIYGLAFIKAGNVWFPVGLHFAWNFVQGPLLGFPVSGMDAGGLQRIHDLGPAWLTGGAYGPEAGAIGIAFRFVIIALVLAWVARTASARQGTGGVAGAVLAK
ncbi:CPBP family intramembrane glutamic endopeptidase [Pseudoduganella sp. OTU4001]|uniref:CPBP family intramembrane glutamic endopeptidase n=1 Tax=Pseudoduganella sp. OTU4001 TaxID=3043854 RepID=UPI00313BDC90